MTATLLLLAFGNMPCLPDELGREDSGIHPAAAALSALEDRPDDRAPPTPPEPTLSERLGLTEEASRYRVAYSLLGQLGEIEISFAVTDDGIRASGRGHGSFLGMGEFEKRLSSELAVPNFTSRRWVASRVREGEIITDTATQAEPGAVELVRDRTDRPQEGHRFQRQRPVLDPLGFLWQMRQRPPTVAAGHEVLDGRALWLITVEPAMPTRLDGKQRALLVRGRANPIYWDGSHDERRTARSFTLFLDDDAPHTPLRLAMPLALGEVRVDLAALHRPVGQAQAKRGRLASETRR